MLFLSCQSRELRHNAFTSEWPEGWLSSAFPFLMEMGKSAGKMVFLFYLFIFFFVAQLLTLFFSAHSLLCHDTVETYLSRGTWI